VADTYTQTAVREEPVESAPSRRNFWRRWPAWIVSLAVLLWAGSAIASLAIDHSSLKTRLTSHVEAAFGRPVEVGRYTFRAWGGPSLEAGPITVEEDPRFGREFFLRADSITMRLRWQSLLRGHIEFGALLLQHPSLNVVRNAAGEWNLGDWLPRPAQSSAPNTPVGRALPFHQTVRFRRIEVEDGRINFKRGDEKVPVAFTGVNGTVDAGAAGRWRLDLEATPWRAAALVQQAGSIHVSGFLAGTSSRLRPAQLDLSWAGASISDVLRLVSGDDHGIRGAFGLTLSARTHDEDEGWTAVARAELRQIHRWDLASRPDNPSVNFTAEADWRGGTSNIELNQLALEAPHSNAYAAGRLVWNQGTKPGKAAASPVDVTVFLSQIDLRDALAWLRAFHAGVADDVSVRGSVGVRATLSGWPPRVVGATLSSEGADLSAGGLRVPVHLGRIQISYDHGIASLLPTTLSLGAPIGPAAASFELSGVGPARAASQALPDWRAAGNAIQMRDLVATAAVLGWSVSRDWDLAGPFSCDLTWHGVRYPWLARPVGWIEVGAPGADGDGASLRAPFLNQPIRQIHARADLKAAATNVTLAAAEAFGTHLAGSIDRAGLPGEWRFSLSAGRLEAAGLDRWLNPRWRESFLDRMLPFLNARIPAVAVPENLRATGHLNLDQFALAPLSLRAVKADLTITGRHIEVASAAGEFYGGSLGGSFSADLEAVPSYDASVDFSRVDLAALDAASPNLAGLFEGSASGEASFHAQGGNRADLITSLDCRGTASVANLELRSIDLSESLREAARRPGSSPFRQASGGFTCGNGAIQFQNLLLLGPAGRIDGTGSATFAGNLDLRLRLFPALPGPSESPASQASYSLTGPVAAPEVAPIRSPRRAR
jgi:hypothetical protein